ncbi:hypothetical protein H6M51_21840 [Rhizobium sp. AQ_MP]|uniref:hypothetical protein n=1 Tax=Rhizobium sp. AQ_MP TaxID=2761536 RepID=UPI00163A88BE|nr:hypothetical protein [Rhizobium sp. AQ_MP]MBC2775508.1 hypothetical protein [Rhizobium sp. AQ_MP]
MQIIGTEIIESPEASGSFVVEFHGDGGERVSVQMAQTESGALTRDNALGKAQVLLLQASRFDMTDAEEKEDAETGQEPSEAVESLRQEQQEKSMQRGGSALEEGLEDTYPASDPVSATYTSTIAGDRKH